MRSAVRGGARSRDRRLKALDEGLDAVSPSECGESGGVDERMERRPLSIESERGCAGAGRRLVSTECTSAEVDGVAWACWEFRLPCSDSVLPLLTCACSRPCGALVASDKSSSCRRPSSLSSSVPGDKGAKCVFGKVFTSHCAGLPSVSGLSVNVRSEAVVERDHSELSELNGLSVEGVMSVRTLIGRGSCRTGGSRGPGGRGKGLLVMWRGLPVTRLVDDQARARTMTGDVLCGMVIDRSGKSRDSRGGGVGNGDDMLDGRASPRLAR